MKSCFHGEEFICIINILPCQAYIPYLKGDTAADGDPENQWEDNDAANHIFTEKIHCREIRALMLLYT